MKYSVLIIESNDFYDYYDNLLKADLDRLIKLSLERNFSVIVRKYEKEE